MNKGWLTIKQVHVQVGGGNKLGILRYVMQEVFGEEILSKVSVTPKIHTM